MVYKIIVVLENCDCVIENCDCVIENCDSVVHWSLLKYATFMYAVKKIHFFFTGQLLFPLENSVAVILLCSDSSFHPSLHQSIWQWPSSLVFHRLRWALVFGGAVSLCSYWSSWCKSMWNTVLSFIYCIQCFNINANL